jgi:hypothetical protein
LVGEAAFERDGGKARTWIDETVLSGLDALAN